MPYNRINIRWIIDVNIKLKLEENIGEFIYNPCVGEGFLNMA